MEKKLTIEPASSKNIQTRFRDYLEHNKDGIKTGYPQLDKATGGLQGICIIAGQPKCGKSAFVLNICSKVELPVLYFDYENGMFKTLSRLMCITEKIDYAQFDAEYTCRFIKAEPDKYFTVCKRFHFVEDRRTTLDKADNIIEEIMKFHDSDKILIVIDSVQKAPDIAKGDSTRESINAFLRVMERIKIQYNAVIIAVSEYSRPGNSKDYHNMPIQTSLKETGDLEYTGDLVLGFSKPKKPDAVKETRLHVLANRNGSFEGEIPNALYRLVYPYWQVEEVEVDFRGGKK